MNQPKEGCGSIELAEDFLRYVKANPTLRFWQALLAWSELGYIVHMPSKTEPSKWEDTFYWQGKRQ